MIRVFHRRCTKRESRAIQWSEESDSSSRPLALHLLVPKTNIEIRPSLIKRSSFPFAIFVSFMKKDKREENSGISLPRNKHFPLFFLSFSFYNYRYYFFLHLGMVFLQEERKQERKRRF